MLSKSDRAQSTPREGRWIFEHSHKTLPHHCFSFSILLRFVSIPISGDCLKINKEMHCRSKYRDDLAVLLLPLSCAVLNDHSNIVTNGKDSSQSRL